MSSSLLLTLAMVPAGPIFGHKPLPPVIVPADAPYGYTYAPAHDLHRVPRYPARRYDPRPGDVILMSDPTPRSRLLYALALTGAPGHGGVVVRRADGTLGLLEAGFNESLRTRVVPLDYRLAHYPGSIWVRRLCRPLTPAQDACLTDFAARADGTRYSLLGIGVQLTPLSHRGLLRTAHLGRPRGPGGPLFCSEAILEALVYAGAVDADTARPSATLPPRPVLRPGTQPLRQPPPAVGRRVGRPGPVDAGRRRHRPGQGPAAGRRGGRPAAGRADPPPPVPPLTGVLVLAGMHTPRLNQNNSN